MADDEVHIKVVVKTTNTKETIEIEPNATIREVDLFSFFNSSWSYANLDTDFGIYFLSSLKRKYRQNLMTRRLHNCVSYLLEKS